MKTASFLSPGQFQSKSIRIIPAVALILVTGRVILADYVTMTLLSVLRSREGSSTYQLFLPTLGHYVTWVISVMIEFIQGHPPCTSTFLVLSCLIRCHIKFLSLSDFIYANLLFDLRHMALFTPIYDTLWSVLCRVVCRFVCHRVSTI